MATIAVTAGCCCGHPLTDHHEHDKAADGQPVVDGCRLCGCSYSEPVHTSWGQPANLTEDAE